MKYLLGVLSILLLSSCSPVINQHFEDNKYIRNYNLHISNDSLQLYFYSPADIKYAKTKKELRQSIKDAGFKPQGEILVYGKTNQPPYEYFVTLDGNRTTEYAEQIVVLDTLVNGQLIQFLGNPLTAEATGSLTADLEDSFRSLESGPGYRQEIVTILDIVDRYRYSNKYYAALQEITEFPPYDEQEAGVKLQMQLTFASFMGVNDYYTSLLQQMESNFKPNKRISETIQKHAIPGQSVIETLISEADKHRVIMINENHFYPNHRMLLTLMLPRLKELGYNYLALEALDQDQDVALNQDMSFPTMESGFYTQEQWFSQLIRKAKSLGFRFVAYENLDPEKDREVGQAENLYNKTFGQDPTTKVIVLAGIDHILEKPTASGEQWMASVFKERYEIDPLTISQTHLNAYRNQIDSGYALLRTTHFQMEPLTSVDYQVLNNVTGQLIGEYNSLNYVNEEQEAVQLMLFYGNELADESDYRDRTPYFSHLIKAGERVELPIAKDQPVYLFTIDKSGKRLDKQKINPTNF